MIAGVFESARPYSFRAFWSRSCASRAMTSELAGRAVQLGCAMARDLNVPHLQRKCSSYQSTFGRHLKCDWEGTS